MAKLAKGADASALSNGYDSEKLRRYIERIEELQAEIESEKAKYMNRCRQIRGSIDVVYKEAKGLGYPTKAIKAHVSMRALERRKEAVVEKLGEDDAEAFEMMAEALGDFASTPLGAAAVQRAADPADKAALATLM